jgi:hypothetical protein
VRVVHDPSQNLTYPHNHTGERRCRGLRCGAGRGYVWRSFWQISGTACAVARHDASVTSLQLALGEEQLAPLVQCCPRAHRPPPPVGTGASPRRRPAGPHRARDRHRLGPRTGHDPRGGRRLRQSRPDAQFPAELAGNARPTSPPSRTRPDRGLASWGVSGLLGGGDDAGKGLADAVGGLVGVGLAGVQPGHHRLDGDHRG